MLFRQRFGQTNVTSLVERVQPVHRAAEEPNRQTRPVLGKVIRAIRDLPFAARRSITFDRGTEFVS
jgi:IS30 family transposase